MMISSNRPTALRATTSGTTTTRSLSPPTRRRTGRGKPSTACQRDTLPLKSAAAEPRRWPTSSSSMPAKRRTGWHLNGERTSSNDVQTEIHGSPQTPASVVRIRTLVNSQSRVAVPVARPVTSTEVSIEGKSDLPD